jgi:phosphoribosylformimino-5-aminoimidazole carboxamide ribotide isomerase
MIIYPAIDLRRGRCVRLVQGDPRAETVVGDDPAAVARRWVSLGAAWLHVVNLDGAFGEEGSANAAALHAILAVAGVPVQFGGGLRSMAGIEAALALGVARVVVGTAALADPDLLRQALDRLGSERVAAGIDARDGIVATHGWQQTSGVSALDLARRMQALGVTRVVYTDIGRDGTLTGVNAAACAALAQAAGLAVIASGGVATLDDIRRVKAVEADGVEGVIVGKALYAGQVDLVQALEIARSR